MCSYNQHNAKLYSRTFPACCTSLLDQSVLHQNLHSSHHLIPSWCFQKVSHLQWSYNKLLLLDSPFPFPYFCNVICSSNFIDVHHWNKIRKHEYCATKFQWRGFKTVPRFKSPACLPVIQIFAHVFKYNWATVKEVPIISIEFITVVQYMNEKIHLCKIFWSKKRACKTNTVLSNCNIL